MEKLRKAGSWERADAPAARRPSPEA